MNALTAAVMGYLGGLPLHDSLGALPVFEGGPGAHANRSWPSKGGTCCC